MKNKRNWEKVVLIREEDNQWAGEGGEGVVSSGRGTDSRRGVSNFVRPAALRIAGKENAIQYLTDPPQSRLSFLPAFLVLSLLSIASLLPFRSSFTSLTAVTPRVLIFAS
ncbi:hypothetical protein E2C01_094784 [Portunus trituberculatus]|uniref:Uncharacterized protein n=1 Tax=Portunus trituberculatus TaxID=210409 RepID=A0A5B7K435_PORTR|nr:hypothetical protein [Portunus trituberculatus]